MVTVSETASNRPKRFQPAYGSVLYRFVKNSIIREMTFRSHFLITLLTRAFWFVAQLVLFELIYQNVNSIADWNRAEYFAFIATGMLINAIVETFFMPNCANFSELIRTGNLDFLLLKPIDTQFIVSFEKINFAMFNQVFLAIVLLGYSLHQLNIVPTVMGVIQYAMLVGFGVVFFYSMMLILASTSVWFGRNQGLYDFWFYITVFARYPREVYSGGPMAEAFGFTFSYLFPILVVVTVPARILVEKTLESSWLLAMAPIGSIVLLGCARYIFYWSINRYRSASS